MESPSFADQVFECAIRIQCEMTNGVGASGSGFFFNFSTTKGNVPTIVTNRHVIAGAKTGILKFHLANSEWKRTEGIITLRVEDFESAWIQHPEVDLAIFPVQILHREHDKEDVKLFRRAFNETHIPSEDELRSLVAIENVVMVGYPLGLIDEKNNSPLVRSGITATPPYLDYNGQSEFVVDIASFPGSSGSPICLYNNGSYASKDGGFVLGARVKLLGILYGGPQYAADGTIIVEDIPTKAEPVLKTRIPINLGYAINARRLLDFVPMLNQLNEGKLLLKNPVPKITVVAK